MITQILTVGGQRGMRRVMTFSFCFNPVQPPLRLQMPPAASTSHLSTFPVTYFSSPPTLYTLLILLSLPFPLSLPLIFYCPFLSLPRDRLIHRSHSRSLEPQLNRYQTEYVISPLLPCKPFLLPSYWHSSTSHPNQESHP